MKKLALRLILPAALSLVFLFGMTNVVYATKKCNSKYWSSCSNNTYHGKDKCNHHYTKGSGITYNCKWSNSWCNTGSRCTIPDGS